MENKLPHDQHFILVGFTSTIIALMVEVASVVVVDVVLVVVVLVVVVVVLLVVVVVLLVVVVVLLVVVVVVPLVVVVLLVVVVVVDLVVVVVVLVVVVGKVVVVVVSLGQRFSLHRTLSLLPPLHFLPLPLGLTVTLLSLTVSPPSHEAEHSLQLPQSVHSQFTDNSVVVRLIRDVIGNFLFIYYGRLGL